MWAWTVGWKVVEAVETLKNSNNGFLKWKEDVKQLNREAHKLFFVHFHDRASVKKLQSSDIIRVVGRTDLDTNSLLYICSFSHIKCTLQAAQVHFRVYYWTIPNLLFWKFSHCKPVCCLNITVGHTDCSWGWKSLFCSRRASVKPDAAAGGETCSSSRLQDRDQQCRLWARTMCRITDFCRFFSSTFRTSVVCRLNCARLRFRLNPSRLCFDHQ